MNIDNIKTQLSNIDTTINTLRLHHNTLISLNLPYPCHPGFGRYIDFLSQLNIDLNLIKSRLQQQINTETKFIKRSLQQ
jgi:hypothetical protein